MLPNQQRGIVAMWQQRNSVAGNGATRSKTRPSDRTDSLLNSTAYWTAQLTVLNDWRVANWIQNYLALSARYSISTLKVDEVHSRLRLKIVMSGYVNASARQHNVISWWKRVKSIEKKKVYMEQWKQQKSLRRKTKTRTSNQYDEPTQTP